MTANATYTPGCFVPKAYGLIDWVVYTPSYVPSSGGGYELSTVYRRLGTSTDTTEFQNQPFMNEIHSDRHGGESGPPVEIQYLGHTVKFVIELTTWDDAVLDLLRDRAFGPYDVDGLVNPTYGIDTQWKIGQNMLINNPIRVTANTEKAEDVRNFWCCVNSEPIACGMGTKWAAWRIPFTAYRVPCNAPAAIAGRIEDRTTQNNTLVPAASP